MSEQPTSAQVRRLLRALNLPAQASKVLSHPRYWNEPFYLLYEDACETQLFTDPPTGLAMARFAPALARRIAPESCLDHPTGSDRKIGSGRRIGSGRAAEEAKARRKQELEMRALCVLAGAYRRVGDLAQAEATYRLALEFEDVSPDEQANLSRRLAVLRLDQGRIEEALALVNLSIGIYRQSDPHLFATALLIRGAIFLEIGRYSEAILDNAAALPRIDAKKSPKHFHAAIHNLCHALTRGAAFPEDLGAAIHYLRKANRLIRAARKSLPKLKLKWIHGLILNKLGSTRRGEALLESARQGLAELQAPFEVAMVSLDLSAHYLREGRYWKLPVLAEETYQLFKALSLDAEAVAALHLWSQATQAEVLTLEMIAVTRDALLKKGAR